MGPMANLAKSAIDYHGATGVGGPATAFHSVCYYGVTLSVRF